MTHGSIVIKDYLKQIPEKPGIYKMLDQNNNILYVGKAKNLLNRVSNYTQLNGLTNRIKTMVSQVRSVEILITKTEKEALILEANLIKTLKPKFNILLKDDKSFPYILIREDHDFGQILKHRGKKNFKGQYFGPFAAVKNVNDSIDYLQKTFLLRPCTDSFFASRNRPCIQYEIKKCSAPCVGKISKEDYLISLNQAKKFLNGKCKNILVEIANLMEEASNNLQYEKAAEYRDRLKALKNIHTSHNLISNIPDSDYIAIISEGNICCIQIFIFRHGQNYGNKVYFPEQTIDFSNNEILSIFLANFYQTSEAPKEIVINCNLDNHKLLQEIFKTKIIIPAIGQKKAIMDFVIQNTKQAISSKLSEQGKQLYFLNEVKKIFNIKNDIKRIDVFDNSHLFGKQALGAMIVATTSGFNKKHYRLYDISSTKSGDDYSMLEEVLKRRYKRMLKENNSYISESWPDLILIDGGPGHLSIAQKVFDELNLQIPFVCIAKGTTRNSGDENFYQTNKPPFTLSKDNHAMQYLQRLRDEAHRFAITSHRKKRSKNIFKSQLDEIPNIGPIRKKLLLHHFGSVAAIADATIKEIENVKTISQDLAKQIYEYFHP